MPGGYDWTQTIIPDCSLLAVHQIYMSNYILTSHVLPILDYQTFLKCWDETPSPSQKEAYMSAKTHIMTA